MSRVAVLACLLFAAPRAARAQLPEDAPTTPESPLDEAARAEAAAAFDAGVAAFAAGDLERARVAFERALAISGHSTVLFNLAETQRRLGRLREAEASYASLLARDDLDEATRARARHGYDEARARLATLGLVIEQLAEADVVRLDGARVPQDRLGRLRLDPGAHVLEIVRPGAFVRIERVVLAAGETREVRLRVPALIEQPEARGPVAVAPDPAAPEVGPTFLETWGHALLGMLIGSAWGLAVGAGVTVASCADIPDACDVAPWYGAVIAAAVYLPLGTSLGTVGFGRLAGGTGTHGAPYGLAALGVALAGAVGYLVGALMNDFAIGYGVGMGTFGIIGPLLAVVAYRASRRAPPSTSLAPFLGPRADGLVIGVTGTL